MLVTKLQSATRFERVTFDYEAFERQVSMSFF